jgi:hypothetical protein
LHAGNELEKVFAQRNRAGTPMRLRVDKELGRPDLAADGVPGARSRVGARFVAVVMVTMVGAGACAFDPRGDEAGADELQPVSVAESATGASASPAPSRQPSGPTSAPTPPKPTPTRSAPAGPTPKTTTTSPDRTPAPSHSDGCPQGDYQRDVEEYLARLGGFGAVTVDGVQSPADCKAIKKFQQRYGIQPAAGRAGPTTRDVARRLANTDTGDCDAGAGTTFCVNLTLQTVWAMRDGRVVMEPTVTRTGMRGYPTPAGTFTIDWRNLKEWSNPYEVWLPYWQHFNQGMGFHETTTYIHDAGIGSHGCVNLLPVDARRMWDLGRAGAEVHLFGRRPGT